MLSQSEESLVEVTLRERNEEMVQIEARLQQNRATALAELVQRVVAENERLSGTCTWKYDDMLDVYETDCGSTMWFSDGTPAQNGAAFCSQCGRRIVVEMPDYEEANDAD